MVIQQRPHFGEWFVKVRLRSNLLHLGYAYYDFQALFLNTIISSNSTRIDDSWFRQIFSGNDPSGLVGIGIMGVIIFIGMPGLVVWVWRRYSKAGKFSDV